MTERKLLVRRQPSILENHFALLKKKRTTPKTNPKIIPKERAAREAEEEETLEAEGAETTLAKDHICSASVVERLGTHQINVGLHGTPSKTSITRRKMTVNLLILLIVLLHIVILELMK